MKTRKIRIIFVLLVVCAGMFLAAAKDEGEIVDSGSFGVLMNGRRMATETFTIRQGTDGSVANSAFKTDQGTAAAQQTSELQLTAGGDLLRYEWKEVSPGKQQAVVTPKDEFLVESFTDAQNKKQEHPFVLPASTNILDDYFFVHRQILAWKYLALACKQEKGQVQCPLKQKSQFGTLNPHGQLSMLVSLEYMGRESVVIRGAQRELNRLDLKSEGGDWALWLDDQFKLIRILVPADNTEILRD